MTIQHDQKSRWLPLDLMFEKNRIQLNLELRQTKKLNLMEVKTSYENVQLYTVMGKLKKTLLNCNY